MVTKNTLKL